MFIEKECLWLLCVNYHSVTSRSIPKWKQIIFTGTEKECIQFFIKVDFDGNISGWIDDHKDVEKEVQERWKDFGSYDYPWGYTRVHGKVSDLWKKDEIMWGMDNYVTKIE